jgi:hypothetical protein
MRNFRVIVYFMSHPSGELTVEYLTMEYQEVL